MTIARKKVRIIAGVIGVAALAGAIFLAWTLWPTREAQRVLRIENSVTFSSGASTPDSSSDYSVTFDAKGAVIVERNKHLEARKTARKLPASLAHSEPATGPLPNVETVSYTLTRRAFPWGERRALLTQKEPFFLVRLSGQDILWMEYARPSETETDDLNFSLNLLTAAKAAADDVKGKYQYENFLLDSAALRQPPQKGETRREFALPTTPVVGQTFICRMSREGGQVQRTPLDTNHLFPEQALWPGKSAFVYWRQQHPGKAILIGQGMRFRVGVPPTCELMRSPIDGGPPQSVATGLYPFAFPFLDEGQQVVAWPDVHEGQKRQWRFQRFAARSDARPLSLPVIEYKDLNGTNIQNIPVESGGFWYAIEKPKMDAEQSAAFNPDMNLFWGQIVRFRPDGSERRVVVRVSRQDGVVRYPVGIIAGERQLYLLYKAARSEPKHWGDKSPDGLMHWYFAPLSPEAAEPIGEARELPLQSAPLTGVIDGDSFYFEEYQDIAGWREQLTDIFYQSSVKTSQKALDLYRLRL